jgi:hypothetical protein
MLYYFGMPPFRDHWDYFRDLLGQQHLPVDLFRGYVTNVVHERDVCVSQRQHEQLVEQINFLSKVRRGAVTQDLDGIEEMEWPEGPNFWSQKCDAQLMLSLTRRGFSSTTLLIYESIEHWPFEIQKVIGWKVRQFRQLSTLEEWQRTPINPWRLKPKVPSITCTLSHISRPSGAV